MALTPEERLAKRAALPAHLRLGVTLSGMRELLLQLPSDAVEQVNANIPRDKVTGEPKFPENDEENGYVNQFFLILWEREDGLAVCERLLARGSPHVGKATVFVSWYLNTPIATLLDALARFLEEKGLRDEDTFFWVCDYVIRQTDVKAELALLGACVSAIGHTVLLMEPWNDPQPLKRAYCIKEVYYTQASGATFDMVMSTKQQAAFETALVTDFGSIQASMAKVDVRDAKCRNLEETEGILGELDSMVGFGECNKLVIGLLNENLAAHGRAALALLPAAERGTSTLIDNLGRLLKKMGQMKEARTLLEQAMHAKVEVLGNRHPKTLVSIHNMGKLLAGENKLYEARPLLEEALLARRETLGDCHPDTLLSIYNMGWLLMYMRKLKESMPLNKEALQARRETLGDRHPDTLLSVGSMGQQLRMMGQNEEARPLYEEAMLGYKETLGQRHPDTLIAIGNFGNLLNLMGQNEEARPLLEEAVRASRETLGDRHPHTVLPIQQLARCLMSMGLEEEARPLFEEAAKTPRFG